MNKSRIKSRILFPDTVIEHEGTISKFVIIKSEERICASYGEKSSKSFKNVFKGKLLLQSLIKEEMNKKPTRS